MDTFPEVGSTVYEMGDYGDWFALEVIAHLQCRQILVKDLSQKGKIRIMKLFEVDEKMLPTFP